MDSPFNEYIKESKVYEKILKKSSKRIGLLTGYENVVKFIGQINRELGGVTEGQKIIIERLFELMDVDSVKGSNNE